MVFVVCFAGYLAAEEARETNLSPVEPGLPQDRPAVLGVIENSPGAIAGLEVGDLIVSVDGEEISTKDQFVRLLRKKKNEKKSVPLAVLRDGALQNFIVEFRGPTERLGIDIGDYFLITGKAPQPLALLQKKGDFGIGINGKVLAGEVVKFNIRVDNFSKTNIKISPDSIMVTANGIPLTRLSPEEAAEAIYSRSKVFRQIELKRSEIPPGRFIIGSLFYKNCPQRYPINLKIEVGDEVFNFSFEKEEEGGER